MAGAFSYKSGGKTRTYAEFRPVYDKDRLALEGDIISNPYTGFVTVKPDCVRVPKDTMHDVSRYLIRLGWSLAV